MSRVTIYCVMHRESRERVARVVVSPAWTVFRFDGRKPDDTITRKGVLVRAVYHQDWVDWAVDDSEEPVEQSHNLADEASAHEVALEYLLRQRDVDVLVYIKENP